jgi:diguanylate cyclase (GGDEF)-like protein
MKAPRGLTRRLFGADPKQKRLIQYWAAAAVMYLVCALLLLLQVVAGNTDPARGLLLATFSVGGALAFYVPVRWSAAWRLAPRTLAVMQGLFGVACNLWLYAISGPLRMASLLLLVVVIAFCTFAMRPRQTIILSSIALAGMAALMWWRVQDAPALYPPSLEALTFGYLAASLLTVTVLTGEMHKLRARLKRQKEDLLSAVDTIRTLATIDELTSLANRRYMNDVLEQEQRRVVASGETSATCIALLDIDFFKRVNDRHGHAGGDAVLRAFAGAARAELRAADVLARWGGEEFLLMLPSTRLPEAQQVLARMAQQVAAMTVPGVFGLGPVSFSAGVVARHDGEAFAETVSRADKALYQAKEAGRNRVVTA